MMLTTSSAREIISTIPEVVAHRPAGSSMGETTGPDSAPILEHHTFPAWWKEPATHPADTAGKYLDSFA